MESLFRDVQHRLERTMGQRAACRRRLHRLGAWELLPPPTTQAECLEALRSVEPTDLAVEQQRLGQHLQRFRLHTRSKRRATDQLDLETITYRGLGCLLERNIYFVHRRIPAFERPVEVIIQHLRPHLQ